MISASCHLLFYVVSMCQTSFSSIDTFTCYKQKRKLVSFNLAHSVCASSMLLHDLVTTTNAVHLCSGGSIVILVYAVEENNAAVLQ